MPVGYPSLPLVSDAIGSLTVKSLSQDGKVNQLKRGSALVLVKSLYDWDPELPTVTSPEKQSDD
jgi:hypothetical protein